ncbi:MAG: hypothetical protein AAB570_00470, partial [Patescibacteria group bacterium]
DHVIDMGPEGGVRGGCVVAAGTPEAVAKVAESLTGLYLKHELKRFPARATKTDVSKKRVRAKEVVAV